nr:hypothetical protein [Tanacetum cinerariifolium]
MIAQSSALPTVADEPASPVKDDSQGEACPTDSGFIADQDRATIAKSSTLPRDLLPRVTSPAAEEGSMQQTLNELTAFCTSLQRQHLELLAKFQAQEVEINRLKDRVKNLEDQEGVIGDKSGDDAPIKGRSTNEKEAPAKKISTDSEEIARVLTSMDAATVLAGETNVPTGSEWKLYDLSGVHHVTAKDKEIFMLVEKDYPLRRGLALMMISYKLQVEDYSQMVEYLIRKIYNIANTLRKQSD